MADNRQDPLIESLMALAVSAAPLIKRARDSGMFKATRAEAASDIVDAEVVEPVAKPEPVDFSAEKSALQDIIVSQVMKIAQLEAEVAKLSAKLVKGGKAPRRSVA
jgi:hypothetical protein